VVRVSTPDCGCRFSEAVSASAERTPSRRRRLHLAVDARPKARWTSGGNTRVCAAANARDDEEAQEVFAVAMRRGGLQRVSAGGVVSTPGGASGARRAADDVPRWERASSSGMPSRGCEGSGVPIAMRRPSRSVPPARKHRSPVRRLRARPGVPVCAPFGARVLEDDAKASRVLLPKRDRQQPTARAVGYPSAIRGRGTARRERQSSQGSSQQDPRCRPRRTAIEPLLVRNPSGPSSGAQRRLSYVGWLRTGA
jgi:hypothetical protein